MEGYFVKTLTELAKEDMATQQVIKLLDLSSQHLFIRQNLHGRSEFTFVIADADTPALGEASKENATKSFQSPRMMRKRPGAGSPSRNAATPTALMVLQAHPAAVSEGVKEKCYKELSEGKDDEGTQRARRKKRAQKRRFSNNLVALKHTPSPSQLKQTVNQVQVFFPRGENGGDQGCHMCKNQNIMFS